MSDELIDHEARERFRQEWRKNFAVSANAGSGKTTAISERLAAMALSDEASAVLPKTAVVTFTKKAAQQIGQRARVERGAQAESLGECGHDELDRDGVRQVDHARASLDGSGTGFTQEHEVAARAVDSEEVDALDAVVLGQRNRALDRARVA